MALFTIPVAFSVNAETEEEAAREVEKRLGEVTRNAPFIVGPGVSAEVEDWSMPNHPWADGSDETGLRLVWKKKED